LPFDSVSHLGFPENNKKSFIVISFFLISVEASSDLKKNGILLNYTL